MRLIRDVCFVVATAATFATAHPASAITGGYSVADALARIGDNRGAAEREAVARDVARFTVFLKMSDAGRVVKSACTGVLVHPRVVLTAGHCLYGDGGARLRARTFFPIDGARPAWRDAVGEAIHPRFARLYDAVGVRPREGENPARYLRRRGDFSAVDLALILLHRAAPEGFGPVRTVAPGFRDSTAASRVIAGYGLADGFASDGVPTLRFAEVRMSVSPDHADGALVIESRVGARGRIGTCFGDSGGPLLVAAEGGRWRLVGIHSAVDRHCREETWMAGIEGERAALRALFGQLTAGTDAEAENPF